MVFFECLKSSLPIANRDRILNSEGLIHIFFEVAVNIVKQRNRRYRPMWLVKDYIRIAQSLPIILDKELFKNQPNLT